MRFVVSFVVTVFALLGINYFGWIIIHPIGGIPWPWSYIAAAAVISLVDTLLGYLALVALISMFGLLVAGGAGVGAIFRDPGTGIGAAVLLGCILTPAFIAVASVVSLFAISWLVPELLELTSNIWLTLLTVVVLTLLQTASSTRFNSRD